MQRRGGEGQGHGVGEVIDEPEIHRAAEERARQAGLAAFGNGWSPRRRAIAPGRIELLGNHVDYNGGPVLSAAIDRAVVVLAGEPRSDVDVVTADIPSGEGASTRLSPDELRGWRFDGRSAGPLDYVRGLVAAILERPGIELRPSALAIAGDIAIGFGLSSSAALCVGLALVLTEEAPAPTDLVLLAQEAEHRVGAPVGTMDQSASVAGGVIRFDGATLGVDRLNPDLGDLVFAVAGSGVERSLSASSYPERVEESKQALDIARRELRREVPHLAALTESELNQVGHSLPEPLRSRARHVVTETARVREGEIALRRGDWPAFGRLMTDSGRSSATDYAISHPRVEELVADALAVEGVLGARMMGGGEGGTALVLLRRDRVAGLESTLRTGYYRHNGMAHVPDLIHVCAFADGARLDELR